MYEFRDIAVFGAGTMGRGIALSFALYGYRTVCVDPDPAAVERARDLVKRSASVMLDGDFITEEQVRTAESCLSFSLDPEAAADADFALEAVPENPGIKASAFTTMNGVCRPDAVLASTTSAMNVYDVVSVDRPERVIITHFNNPPHIIPLVEEVLGPDTPPELAVAVRALLESIGKEVSTLRTYVPGFIVNRLSTALFREAAHMVENGWVSPEDVDKAFSANQGLKAPFEGPVELMDYIGWDVAYGAGSLINRFICNSPEGSPFALKMVKEGRLGVKSGRGIRDYGGQDAADVLARREEKILKVAKLARELRKS